MARLVAKTLQVTKKAVKVINGHIHIHKYYKKTWIRQSLKLVANEANLNLVYSKLEEITRNLFYENGFILKAREHNVDESFYKSFCVFVDALKNTNCETSLKSYESLKNEIKEYFGDKRSNSLDEEWIQSYAVSIKTLSKARIKFKVNAIVAALNHYRNAFSLPLLDKKGSIKISHLGKEAKDEKPFSENEIAKILNTSKEMLENAKSSLDKEEIIKSDLLNDYLTIAFHTGARNAEIYALDSNDIDLKNNVIRFKKQVQDGKEKENKRDSGRVVPIINENFRIFLESFKKKIGNKKHIFADIKNNIHHGWKKILEIAQIDYRKIYTTRASFASNAYLRGVNIGFISRILGHSSIQMTYDNYIKCVEYENENIDFEFSHAG